MVHGHSFLHGKTTRSQSAQKTPLQDLAPRSGHCIRERDLLLKPPSEQQTEVLLSKSELVLLVLLYSVTFSPPAETRQAD